MTTNPLPLAGRRAWVSGASRGIGRACAVRLASLGASVVAVARDDTRLRSLVTELPAPSDGTHEHLALDFTDLVEVENGMRRCLATGPVDVLVNNSGGPPGGRIIDAEPEQFLHWISQHLIVNHRLVQLVVPGMRAQEYGRVVNIISTSVKQPIPGLGVSNTVRGAVANWAKTLAGEIAPHGITVNNVLPGATHTDRLESLIATKAEQEEMGRSEVEQRMLASIPAGRFGRAEEIAAAVGFLASPEAAYITGINLPVDGGRTQSL